VYLSSEGERGPDNGRAAQASRVLAAAVVAAALSWTACSDLRESIAPSVGSGPLTYETDMKAIFDRDCVTCHNPQRAAADYDLSQYDTGPFGGVLGAWSDTILNVIPGDENSLLIQTVNADGSMRRYLGSGADDAARIRRWVTADSARKE